jgi:uncharacterized protein YcbX
MRITTIWRYPVKSMLGERIDEAHVEAGGLVHDRGLALIDRATGMVASAKHPRLWRDLLAYSATVRNRRVEITSPAGWTLDATAPDVDEMLSRGLGRAVRIASERPEGATVERPDPEDVLDQGVDAVVPAAVLTIGRGSPGASFVDSAPVHLITSATLEAVGVEHVRYRPNLVVETPPGTPAFAENDWVGRELHIGDPDDPTTVLQIAKPTPRCAVPTLEHGPLPRAPHAVRALMTANRVDVPGSGVLPCAGCYATVARAGAVRVGDEVTLR